MAAAGAGAGRGPGRGAAARPPAAPPPGRAVRQRHARGGLARRLARRARATSSAPSSAPASSTSAPVEMDAQAQAGPMFEVFSGQGMEEIGINLKDMLSNVLPDAHPAAAGQGRARRGGSSPRRRPRSWSTSTRRSGQAIRRVENSGIVFLDELDKIAGRRGRPRARRVAGGRAAGPPADRRGLDGDHQVRDGPDRSHPVHRGRRLPRGQALRPDPRAAGPVPDPGGAGALDAGGFYPHPERASERPDPAVRGAVADRRGDALASRRTRSRPSPRSRAR